MLIRLAFAAGILIGLFELLFRGWRAAVLGQEQLTAQPPAPEAETKLPAEDLFVPQPAADDEPVPSTAAGNLLCPVCLCRPCLARCRLGLGRDDIEQLTRLALGLDQDEDEEDDDDE